MMKFKGILLLFLFVGISSSLSSKEMDFSASDFPFAEQQKDNTMTLEVVFNGVTRIKLENIPTTGYLEVYSILGVRVTSVNLKNCPGGCNLDLPKGLYILKAGKVAQKVIVR